MFIVGGESRTTLRRSGTLLQQTNGNISLRTELAPEDNETCSSFSALSALFLEAPPSVTARLERALVPRAAWADKSAL